MAKKKEEQRFPTAGEAIWPAVDLTTEETYSLLNCHSYPADFISPLPLVLLFVDANPTLPPEPRIDHGKMGEMGEMSRIIKKNDSVSYQQRKCIFPPTIFFPIFSLSFKCHLYFQII